MRSVRKETGGYALAYVLIVILVLCAIAMTICTIALRNYQGQVRAVAQTQQLYQAEGEIEKFVALAEDVSGLGDSFESEEAARAAYAQYVETLDDTVDSLTVDYKEESDEFAVTYQNEAVKIEASVKMELHFTGEGSIQIQSASHTYNSYTITH